MKKWIKYVGMIFCLIVSVTILSACDFGTLPVQNDGSVPPPVPIKVPSEVRVSGYETEIEVGDDFITKLKVEAKLEGNWEEVVKVDYVVACNYTGSKYGEYQFNVYLKEFPSVEYSDTIVVNPKKVVVPESYSVEYTGEIVDIKSYYEDLSDDYSVTNYVNMSNCGEYEVSLRLTNTDKYVWVDSEDNILKNPTQKIKWNITKAPAKQYTGNTSLIAYAGDTLYDVLTENNLQHITWYRDVNNNSITASTKVDSLITTYYAYYNENPQNYEDTLVTFTINEFVVTANYTVEYYLYDGSDYVINNALTEVISANIGDIVELTPNTLEGYLFNATSSSIVGKVVKKDGLVLKLYYDISE